MTIRPKNTGFTLLELIIVCIIVGITASLVVPGFMTMKEKSLSRDAEVTLGLIFNAERFYRMQVGGPVDCTCLGRGTGASGCDQITTGCNTLMKLAIPYKDWKYQVSGSPTYTITATRSTGNGCVYSLAYNSADGKPIPNNSCP